MTVLTIPTRTRLRIRSGIRAFTTTLLLVIAPAAAASPPQPSLSNPGCEWTGGFGFDDRDSDIFALAVFDDGGGPDLFAGGSFAYVSGWVNHIAKWSGSSWQVLPGGGTTSTVEALTIYDDGGGPALYAGGWFLQAGAIKPSHIAKYDGTAWSVLATPAGTGTNGTVRALAVYDDGSGAALYVGGDFTTAGGIEVNGIAKWDGNAWTALTGPSGTGTNGGVYALVAHDDGSGAALYAGGDFTTAGGLGTSRIARWDGTGWSALSGPAATGTDGTVRTLAAYDDGSGSALFAGGDFTTAGGIEVNRIARWDGTGWSALSGPSGIGTDAGIHALAVYDDGSGEALFAGGDFVTAGGVGASHVARWDGTGWAPLGTGRSYGIYALTVYDDGSGDKLVAGGDSAAAGWDGTSWSGLGSVGFRTGVYALEMFDDGSGPALYAVGNFTTAGGATVNHVAKWNGTAWSALSGPAGTGLLDLAYALAVFDDGSGEALYIGGRFTLAGGMEVNRIVKWDGTSLSPLSGPSGIGTNERVQALAVWDDGSGPVLYAAGRFTTAGGVTVNHVAKWDGNQWSALSGPSGTGTNNRIYAVAPGNDGSGTGLFVAGQFTTAGGVTVNHVAKWDGNEWSALSGPAGTGANGEATALAAYDDGSGEAIYVGGSFTTAGGVSVNHMAKWDGNEWSALSGPSGTGLNGTYVEALTVFDDGSGEALYAGGWFTTAGGVAVNYVARWDGIEWSALSGPAGSGANGGVGGFTIYDDGIGNALVAGGWFSTAGGVGAPNVAKWRCEHPTTIFVDGFESGDTQKWSSTIP